MNLRGATRCGAWAASFGLVALFGYFVGFRGDGVGTDTANYRAHFYRVINGQESRFEPGVRALMEWAGLIGGSHVFFATTFFLIIIFHSGSALILSKEAQAKNSALVPILLVSLLFSSSWFISASINGIRQGIALSIFYFGALLYTFGIKRAIGIIVMLVACTFHYSTLILLPLVAVSPYMRTGVIVAIFIVSAVSYPLGLFEYAFAFIETFSEVAIHTFVIEYADSAPSWRGWQWDLWTYTVGWMAIYYVSIPFLESSSRRTVVNLMRLYMILSLPYFVLGFGSFSNRYGVMAWSILPLLHFSWLVSARLSISLRAIATVGLLGIGVAKFGKILQVI
jgi:hypothetical protein